jgi:hypothetical protein
MQYIFDKPQWQWTRAYKPEEFCRSLNRVKVWNYDAGYRPIIVNIPAEFERYCSNIHLQGKSGAALLLDINIFTLGIGYAFTYEHRGVVYNLWHYKTLPPVFNPEIESVE